MLRAMLPGPTPVLGLLLLVCGCESQWMDEAPKGIPLEPSSTSDSTTERPTVPPARRNILLVSIDDLGVDMLGAFGATDPIHSPQIDALGRSGVRFQSAYSTPLCSPTRAEWVTGLHGHRTGVTTTLHYTDAPLGLPVDTPNFVRWLREQGYATALVGKWHLSTAQGGGLEHALEFGFDVHRGTVGNLGTESSVDGAPMGYDSYEKVEDGQLVFSSMYATREQTDDAIDLIQELASPWFIAVHYNAPHAPWHVPPADLRESSLAVQDGDIWTQYRLAAEAVDRELARLLASLSPDERRQTVIALVSDNGSPEEVVGAPAKSTPYEAGVHVPLIISTAGVVEPNRDSHALVSSVDLMPTLTVAAGLDPSVLFPIDGLSAASVLTDPTSLGPRDFVFSFRGRPNHAEPTNFQRMVRSENWKLVEGYRETTQEVWTELYDMRGRTTEGPNLLTMGRLSSEAEQALEALTAERDRVLAPLGSVPP